MYYYDLHSFGTGSTYQFSVFLKHQEQKEDFEELVKSTMEHYSLKSHQLYDIADHLCEDFGFEHVQTIACNTNSLK